jgi:hypothetical protein
MIYYKHFCTFADSRLIKSLARIEKQAIEMEFYDGIYVFDENKLDIKFKNNFKDQLVKGTRGFGYWSWKPQVILQTLMEVNEGDVIQYSDAGCHLNSKGKKRLQEYFDLAKNSSSGILSFRGKNKNESPQSENYYQNLEYKYNKADLLDYFGLLNDNSVVNTGQFEAGIIFIRKDIKTVKFINDWINVFSHNFNYIDDSPSLIPNHEGFIDHRHDQSIYSILCKLNGVEELCTSEYYTKGNWEELSNSPIWVKRDMNFGLQQKIINFLKKFINYFKKKINV